MKAYYYDNLPGDQREPHDSGRAVPASYLSSLGVLYCHCPSVSAVDAIAAERAYKNRDEITVSPDKMGAVYEDKVKMFFNEHLHEDEEIRYILDGHGYFDVRNEGDEWVRIRLEKDDLLVLPAGIYHRFTTDEGNVSSAGLAGWLAGWLVESFGNVKTVNADEYLMTVYQGHEAVQGRADVDAVEPWAGHRC